MSSNFDVPRRTERRSRPNWLAPVVVGLAALPVGGALALGIAGRSPDTTSAATESSTTVPSTTVPATVLAPVQSEEPENASEPSAAADESTEALGDGMARVNGVVYNELSSCVAFPFSNPDAELFDASNHVSLHLMESPDGDRLGIERWSYDFGGAVGVYPLGRNGGMVDTFDLNQTVPHIIGIAGGSFEAEIGGLTTPGGGCPMLIVEGDDPFDFTALGLVDVCTPAAGHPASEIYTFQGGTTLTRLTDGSGATAFAGELRHEAGRSAVVDGMLSTDESGAEQISGRLEPGLSSAVDSFIFDVGGNSSTHDCLPEQDAATD